MNTSTSKSNRQNILSRSKSRKSNKSFVSPKKNVSFHSQSQSQKQGNQGNIKKIKLSEESIISKMRTIRQKLCQTLDAYILILQTHAPFRCLQHNSILSLYCETQQKLLCANCVYRSNTHKLHRVFPMQKCYKQISRDVDQLTRQVQRQIKWAQSSTKAIAQFFNQQQKNTNQSILVLTQMYDQLHMQLQRSFEQAKKKLLITMNSQFSKKQSIQLEIQFFRNILENNKPAAPETLSKQDNSASQSHLIFNHLIGCALLQYGKMQGNKVVDGVSKIKQIQRKQVQKINQIKQLIENWKNMEKQKSVNQQHEKQKQKQIQKQKQQNERLGKLQRGQRSQLIKQKQKEKFRQWKNQQPKVIN